MGPFGTENIKNCCKVEDGKSSEVIRTGMFTIGITLFRRKSLIAGSQETLLAKSRTQKIQSNPNS